MNQHSSDPDGIQPIPSAPRDADSPASPGPQEAGAGQPRWSGHAGRSRPHTGPADVSLRGPAELADALPYLLGFYPDDSIVAVSLHGERGRFGGRLRIGIPDSPEEWPAIASQVAECMEATALARGPRPDGALIFLCQEPAIGESGAKVKERLAPLAQRLRLACGELDMPVYEALCLSTGRFWSYCCPDPRCCSDEGTPLAAPGTSAMAAAAAYSGMRVHGSLREMEERLSALGPPLAEQQERALDAVGARLVSRMLTSDGRDQVRDETMALVGRAMDRFHRIVAPSGGTLKEEDVHDDGILTHDEAASLILGLQDRRTRDLAAEWMEGLDVEPALRLWRALARRCVGPYAEHAVALLTLAGWVAWSGGDSATARVALAKALRADPEYLFAQLLNQACNEGLDPELLRRCMRRDQAVRQHSESDEEDEQPDAARRPVPRDPRAHPPFT
ncbi:DUF4192 domain-containing protein [Streptomyces albiaxialis]|uniref:DUF4192 domain-containing protein n=1 Tax=Streptomyces albiaxialis TaxID=329523 RepID=A0ABN2WGN3_9ACTN